MFPPGALDILVVIAHIAAADALAVLVKEVQIVRAHGEHHVLIVLEGIVRGLDHDGLVAHLNLIGGFAAQHFAGQDMALAGKGSALQALGAQLNALGAEAQLTSPMGRMVHGGVPINCAVKALLGSW